MIPQDKNMFLHIFSQRLNEGMKLNSLTQSELAKMIGIRQTSVSDYQNGKSVPSADIFLRISLSLGVTMEWLSGIDSESKENGSNLDDLTFARLEITRLRNKLKSATQTLEGAYKLALEALKLEDEK